VISAGSTQPSADWVIEVAMPTTVRPGDPGLPLTVIRVPSGTPVESRDSTTSPGRCGQRPCCRIRSSSGPPGAARPTRVSGGPVN
jgi:hypothetical protein